MSKPFIIVHIDDDPDYLEICKAFLPKYLSNIEILTFESSKEALTHITTSSVDLIISDYNMPGITGLDLLFLLRTNGNEIPFIMLTGKGREEIAIKSLNLGADYYLQKGLDIAICISELTNFVKKEQEAKIQRQRKAELEKQYSETQLHLNLIVNNLPDHVALLKVENNGLGLQFRVIEVNNTYLEDSDLKREDVVGKTIDEFLINEELKKTKQSFRELITTKKLQTREITVYKNDQKICYEVTEVPILNKKLECSHVLRLNRKIKEAPLINSIN